MIYSKSYLELFLLVCQLMLVQIGRIYKRSRALRALVRLFSSMSSHMHHQVVLVFAFVWTQVTEKVECVRVDQPETIHQFYSR